MGNFFLMDSLMQSVRKIAPVDDPIMMAVINSVLIGIMSLVMKIAPDIYYFWNDKLWRLYRRIFRNRDETASLSFDFYRHKQGHGIKGSDEVKAYFDFLGLKVEEEKNKEYAEGEERSV